MRRLPLFGLLALVGCSAPAARPVAPADATPPPAAPRRPAEALAAGVAYLLKQQSPDGAWRSDVYATFKDGPALTPLVVCALQDAGVGAAARRTGSEYLTKLVTPAGSVAGGDGDLDYPAYTAALAVRALSHPDNTDLLKARDAWLKYLLARQLTEALGWRPGDREYGGWGYCRVLPRKPAPNALAAPLIESNLSATAFALDALSAAGVADRAVSAKARAFVRTCQNDDGGFHFIYADPVRNKAGSPDPPPAAPTRFHSYGSTTADGLRALLACGAPAADPHRAAALKWLTAHFRADTHPGQYAEAHERNREAVYFYYAASVARTLRLAKVTEAGGKAWAPALAAELAKRQAADGSWANPVELVRENDPLVATAAAVTALAHCR